MSFPSTNFLTRSFLAKYDLFLIMKERIDTRHITLNFNCIDLHLSLYH